MDRNSRYQKLYKLFCEAYPQKTKSELQNLCATFWKGAKDESDWEAYIGAKESDLAALVVARKQQLRQFFIPVQPGLPIAPPQQPSTSAAPPPPAPPQPAKEQLESQTHPTPKQDELRKKLNIINADIAGLVVRQDCDLLTDQQDKQLAMFRTQKLELEKQIQKLIDGQQRQSKFRSVQKRAKEDIMANEPNKAAKLRFHQTPGRPRHGQEDEILDAIIDIAQYGASAQDRRRFEQFRSVLTLNNLLDALTK